jgi:alkylated DNA repair protein (DNA oxidative demethylase)
VTKKQRLDSPRAELLQSGIVLVRGFLSDEEQYALLNEALKLGATKEGGFFACNNEKTKRMCMMNLGLKTNGKPHKLPIPRSWIETARLACDLAVGACPSIPTLVPDICVANLYHASSKLSLHQDIVTRSSPKAPVISLSIGAPAEFIYKRKWKAKELKRVTLRSGDALIFGAKSRGIIHGISHVHTSATPARLAACMSAPARLNLNFRQF